MEKERRYGVVVSLSGEIANVSITHGKGCSGDHESCPFGERFIKSDTKDCIVSAENKILAKEGQLVEISVEDRKLSGYAFILFILPLFLIFTV